MGNYGRLRRSQPCQGLNVLTRACYQYLQKCRCSLIPQLVRVRIAARSSDALTIFDLILVLLIQMSVLSSAQSVVRVSNDRLTVVGTSVSIVASRILQALKGLRMPEMRIWRELLRIQSRARTLQPTSFLKKSPSDTNCYSLIINASPRRYE